MYGRWLPAAHVHTVTVWTEAPECLRPYSRWMRAGGSTASSIQSLYGRGRVLAGIDTATGHSSARKCPSIHLGPREARGSLCAQPSPPSAAGATRSSRTRPRPTRQAFTRPRVAHPARRELKPGGARHSSSRGMRRSLRRASSLPPTPPPLQTRPCGAAKTLQYGPYEHLHLARCFAGCATAPARAAAARREDACGVARALEPGAVSRDARARDGTRV